MEQNHPNKDPLGIVGKEIGYSKRYKIYVFSHPAMHSIGDKDSLENQEISGESYRYSVQFNFKDAGRKVVTYVVASPTLETGQYDLHAITYTVIKFLEHHAETMLVQYMDDTLLEWDAPNGKDTQ
jgi:hypothetical protein